MRKFNTKVIALGGIIAALYVTLTFISSIFGLASGAIQIRISEALCVLPCFAGAAVPGLFVGCFISNLLFGGGVLDAVIGSVITLLAAIATKIIGKYVTSSIRKYLAVLPPILLNAFILPIVMDLCFNLSDGYWYLFATIFAGEFISAGVLGVLFYIFIGKHITFFRR